MSEGVTKNSLRLFASVSAAAMALGAGVASAQPAAAGASAGAVVGDIVITARKKAENLQHVPVAVTALKSTQLENRGLRETRDLTQFVPSLGDSTGAGGQVSPSSVTFELRGQTAGQYKLNSSQAVGLYEDGVNIPHPVGTQGSFFDLDRVEVLKGPQGTLYGRNTTGGAINIITRGADHNGLHGFLEADVGDYNSFREGGAVNIPIIQDALSARVAYQHWTRDGYGKSTVTGETFGGNKDDNLARLSLRFDPTSNFTVDARAEYLTFHHTDGMTVPVAYSPTAGADLSGGFGYFSGQTGAAAAALANGDTLSTPWATLVADGTPLAAAEVSNSLFRNSSEVNAFDDVNVWHASINARWDINDSLHLRSITGVHDYTEKRAYDIDGTRYQLAEDGASSDAIPAAPLLPGQTSFEPALGNFQTSNFLSQEFNLTGKSFGRLDWLLGAYASMDKGTETEPFAFNPAGIAALSVAFGEAAPYPSYSNSYQPHIDTTTWALFTQNDIHISDRVSLTLGARYTEERLAQTAGRYNYTTDPAEGTTPYICGSGPNNGNAYDNPGPCTIDSRATFSGTSWLASWNYQMTPDQLLYLRASRGFRGGAVQPDIPDASVAPPVAPETATEYELGYKAQFFDKRLRTNFAFYQTNYDNKQEAVLILYNGGLATELITAATARVRGAEWEVEALPTTHWSVHASGSYLDAVYTKYPGAIAPANPGLGVFDGAGIPFAVPKWQYTIGTRYEFPIGAGTLGLNADWNWHSETPITPFNRTPDVPLAFQEQFFAARGLLNARIDYALPDQGITVALWSTNLTDEHYALQGNPAITTSGYFTVVTQPPRMFGVTVKKTFGRE